MQSGHIILMYLTTVVEALVYIQFVNIYVFWPFEFYKGGPLSK